MHPKDSPRPDDGLSEVDYRDRRSEERFSVEGEVNLFFDEPMHRSITGTLVDYSKSGFRAFHNYSELRPGQVVQFRHLVSSGTARVIWNRIVPERVETGFLVISTA